MSLPEFFLKTVRQKRGIMFPPLIFGPTPPYANVPIAPQNYNPSQFFISNVTLGQSTTVTTTVNHNYVIAQLIRLIIPNGYGCTDLNERTGYVISIPAANQFVLNINSQGINPFLNLGLTQKPQCVPVGDVNQGVTNANGRTNAGTSIPGSFVNVSN